MNFEKHTDEMIERFQAHQLLDIVLTSRHNIKWALKNIKRIESESTSLLDLRPTEEIVLELETLENHIQICSTAMKFASSELIEIGFYLN
jgi:hypothetical protein